MQRTTLILAYLFFCANCFAQEYPFVHYTPKDGLVNSRVRKAYQDSKGRMYFLTFGGLSVYDGARFKNYTVLNGLGADLVNDVIELGDDSILIAPNTGVLNKLIKGKIFKVKTADNFYPIINYFYRHNDQSLYLSCDQGLYKLEGDRIRPLNIFSLTKDSLSFPYLGGITGIGNYLFICTDDLKGSEGLYLYDIKNDRICDSLPGRSFRPLGKDKYQRVWITTLGNIYMVDSTSLMQGKLKLISPQLKYDLKEMNIGDINLDYDNAWMLYQNFPMSTENLKIGNNRSVFNITIPEAIISSDIRNVFIDKENSIWLCSNGGGVFKMVQSSLSILENPLGKLPKASIYSAYYSQEGTWYSSNNDKLYRKLGSYIREFKVNLKQSPSIFFADKRKVIGNDARNIFEATIDSFSGVLNFKAIISLPYTTFFTDKRIVDRNGAIIAGVNGGLGVWKNNQQIYYQPLSSIDLIEGLVFDKNGFLWIITRYSGIKVYRLHPENPSQYLEMIHSFSKFQIQGSPRCMLIDKTGMIWIGTREKGLFSYKQENNELIEISHFFTSNGMTDDFVVSLACDSLNNIIAGTQTGVDRITHNTNGDYRIENLTKTNNYFSYINDVWVSADGQGYARTFSGGLLVISPIHLAAAEHAPELLLEEMRMNAIPVNEKKSFSYQQNNLSFFLAAPSFIDEKQVTYSYLLEGSGNKQWSDTTAANAVINLTNLSAGKYKLNVKAFFPSSTYRPAELSYSFEITPPWWQTWWFRIFAGLAIVGISIFGVRFYYKRRLEKQMAVLERRQAIEKERTRIATDMHDDLGAGLSRIKFLSETIGIKKQKQESFEEDIIKIREYSHEMIDKMGEIVWALNQKNDSLSDLLSYSRSYAVEYLSQSGIKCDVQSPDSFPIILLSGEFRRNIYLTLKEALHNIVKHAQANHVNITINVNHNLEIMIQDDGVGFHRNKIRSFSNGLSNMEKRMKDIGGSIQITNDIGTRVELIAPLSP